ncbi:MAG: hypothetical protein LQ338_001163 [Usnochroma carphineum]|nr:MAG: hypothetical protein LQ338_001163 [Usnochroma carphineum]
MRLLNTSSLTLHDFYDKAIPPYAILSHTWGAEEVTFQNLDKQSSKALAGYTKIVDCCALALSDGWQYVWVDTCCIDKKSSAELSEAINSMYQWYKNAEVCYVYMVDVIKAENELPLLADAPFYKSLWFKRGWTLQELLAPDFVVFYDRDWEELGTKLSLRTEVSYATRISSRHFANPTGASVAAKMSWAANRRTTRTEDIAYCLLGLFNVNMPLLYGEGQDAFMRLQEAILNKNSDESIFAWKDPTLVVSGMFAQSPDAFAASGDIVSRVYPQLYRRPSVMTNKGLEIDINMNLTFGKFQTDLQKMIGSKCGAQAILLNCAREGYENDPYFVPLMCTTEKSYVRFSPNILPTWSLNDLDGRCLFDIRREYIEMKYIASFIHKDRPDIPLIVLSPHKYGFSLVEARDEFMNERSQQLTERVDLGGWKVSRIGVGHVMLWFRSNLGENLILEVDLFKLHPEFKVYAPVWKGTSGKTTIGVPDFLKVKEFFASIAGTDRSSVSLQAGRKVSVSMSKKSLQGKISYVIEFQVGEPVSPTS